MILTSLRQNCWKNFSLWEAVKVVKKLKDHSDQYVQEYKIISYCPININDPIQFYSSKLKRAEDGVL